VPSRVRRNGHDRGHRRTATTSTATTTPTASHRPAETSSQSVNHPNALWVRNPHRPSWTIRVQAASGSVTSEVVTTMPTATAPARSGAWFAPPAHLRPASPWVVTNQSGTSSPRSRRGMPTTYRGAGTPRRRPSPRRRSRRGRSRRRAGSGRRDGADRSRHRPATSTARARAAGPERPRQVTRSPRGVPRPEPGAALTLARPAAHRNGPVPTTSAPLARTRARSSRSSVTTRTGSSVASTARTSSSSAVIPGEVKRTSTSPAAGAGTPAPGPLAVEDHHGPDPPLGGERREQLRHPGRWPRATAARGAGG
jgi:hypothetical protein